MCKYLNVFSLLKLDKGKISSLEFWGKHELNNANISSIEILIVIHVFDIFVLLMYY